LHLLIVIVNFLSCNKNQIDKYNSEIFYGNWTQIKNYYKGPPGHLSEIGYGELEIHFVTESKWVQYVNRQDSVECSTWSFFVRNDSLIHTNDELNYYFDTLIIDRDYLTLWFIPYKSDKLPDNWSKYIVLKKIHYVIDIKNQISIKFKKSKCYRQSTPA